MENNKVTNDPESLIEVSSAHLETNQNLTRDQAQGALGTVQLISNNGSGKSDPKDVVLIPAPSADPRDPLNMPTWRKWVFAVILSVFSCTGLQVVSGAGSLISFFLMDYIEAGKGYQDIVNLITIPTLSMGLGNFLFVPIALAIGRRPVYLFSGALLFIASVAAANNTNYEYHLAIRIVIGFAAGQSEALVPLMLKEAFFLHERANILAFQAAFQTTVGCILGVFASNIAAGVGWKNWYYVYAGLSAAIFILAIFFVPETKYERSLEAYNGLSSVPTAAKSPISNEKDLDDASQEEYSASQQIQATVGNRPALDFEKFPAHTLWSRLNPMPAKMHWSEAALSYKHMLQIGWFPNIIIIVLMNSIFLGINIGMGTTFATPLQAPPYNWAPKWSGMPNLGQIVVAFVALPALGFGSDKIIKWRAAKNGGVHEPESRLIALAIPTVIGIVACILFGYAYTYPFKVHWFALVFGYNAQYFAFLAASVAGQTYLLDAYPTRASTVLVLVCGVRGVVSFGLTYSLTPTLEHFGGSHLKQYGLYAGLMSLFAMLGYGLYFFGKKIRLWTLKFVVDEHDKEPHFD